MGASNGRWDPPRSRARSRRLGTRKSARRRSAEHAPRKRYLYTSLRFFLGISMMTECCLSATSARLGGWLSTLEGRRTGRRRERRDVLGQPAIEPSSGVRLANAGPRGARPGRDRRRVRSRRGRDARRAGRVAGAYLGVCAWKGRRGGGVRGARLAATGARRPAPPPARSRGARRAAVSFVFVFVFDAAISSASASRPSRPNRERGLGVRFEIKRSFPESTLVIRRKRIQRRCGRLSDAASGAFADARGFR